MEFATPAGPGTRLIVGVVAICETLTERREPRITGALVVVVVATVNTRPPMLQDTGRRVRRTAQVVGT
jgi:hypothetical protein